ncbi:hypothetical protein QR98_0012510 [Sarcoptes scabiei]|uniref:Receptor ligand binding region domain-containing protein n=1 Tax=Sarcoptes scabiei TaxID=52283 RepID=A0A131ZVH0_SARSC|nr:hypothetical protein QR98_0012510 [Sarcoptes scabiei]
MNLIVPQWAHSAMAMAHHQDDVRSKTLYIAGFFPTSRNIPQGAIGRGVLPAVRLALQHVNESPLFTKYRLDLVWNNTKTGLNLIAQLIVRKTIQYLFVIRMIME